MVHNTFLEYLAKRGFLLPHERSWHSKFIENIARTMRPRSYLEVGVYRGETYRGVAKWADQVFGVDIDPEVEKSIRGLRNCTFVLGTLGPQLFDVFVDRTFDLIFIDANHSKENVISDFEFAEKMLGSEGLLLLHDTWPRNLKYSAPEYCGDAWAAIRMLRELYSNWSFVTIPAHPGLTICQRNSATPF